MPLTIIYYDNPLLKMKSLNVTSFDESLIDFVKEMNDVLAEYPTGIGLAAPQVGVLKRIFITSINGSKRTFINPVIRPYGKKLNFPEGCLSFDKGFENLISRPRYVECQYYDERGFKKKLIADGIFSRCIQHEYDHLEGKLIA